MQNDPNKNRAVLRGTVADDPYFSHRVHGIDFYRLSLCVARLSGREDRINVLIPYPLLEQTPLSPGLFVEVTGEIRSFNNRSGIGSRLVVTLYAKTISISEDEPCNTVFLSGTICKPPILRRTPLGRDICDLLLAVNRKYRRADYLPCIAWGSLAVLCAQLQVGDTVILEGRLQSRIYLKAMGEQFEEHTAFEISIMSLEAAGRSSCAM